MKKIKQRRPAKVDVTGLNPMPADVDRLARAAVGHVMNPDVTPNADQRVRTSVIQNSLRAGSRDSALLEEHIVRENTMYFDQKRLPKRVTHARRAGAHGFFVVYEPMHKLTKAAFLKDPAMKTPVFVRFSTAASSPGCIDAARDLHGFAVRFYTEDGNFDLLGNNIPVSFTQDAFKPPKLIHSVKPEPHHGIPQASSAHDALWDFISLAPESTHAIMWLMSDRVFPRSFQMMEGFGAHTFRFVNAAENSCFVKFHWKPVLGVHSLAWDEAVKLAGKDADYIRRDLWDAIDDGQFPEWELGVQIVPEEDEQKFSFNLLDPTKLIPESLVPVQIVGKLTLNRNPQNYFAEGEQIAFHPGHLVPGIDLSDDPFPPGQISSSTGTQLRGGLVASPDISTGGKLGVHSQSPADHFSQAGLFWRSQSRWEQDHIVSAFCFELGKVETAAVRERVVATLTHVNAVLARRVADGLGLAIPVPPAGARNVSHPDRPDKDAALSMENTNKRSIVGRKIAVLVDNYADATAIGVIRVALEVGGATVKVIAPRLGVLESSQGKVIKVDHSLPTVASVLFDAVFIPGGQRSLETLCADAQAVSFVKEAYKHGKAIAASDDGVRLITEAARSAVAPSSVLQAPGILTAFGATVNDAFVKSFMAAIARHRFTERHNLDAIVA